MSGSLRTLQRARVTSTARARAGGTGSASRNAGYPFALRARPRGRSAVSNLIIVLAVVLVAGMVTVAGAVGAAALTTAAAVGALSEGLPDPSQLAEMTFEQPTIVYDRSGKVELGRFQRVQRRVVSYPEIPKLVLDAATTAEDRTFWTNEGIDPSAILSALAENASGESDRGASTITQQLVRARLLPEEDTAPGADRYLRKAKEIIQSLRLTEQFPGEEGKQADHHRLPQRDLLRSRCVRRRRRGAHLLRRHGPHEADAGAGRAARRAAEVALELRSVSVRRRAGRQARRPAHGTAASSGVTTSSRT